MEKTYREIMANLVKKYSEYIEKRNRTEHDQIQAKDHKTGKFSEKSPYH
jgi:hypothetical protein